MFSAAFLGAEDMKFVTLLSQPVGSFSRVELLDQATPADIFHLNFCNTDASGGTISVSSSKAVPVDVEKLQVKNSATLSGNVDYFRADKINVYSNNGFEGGTLEVELTNPAKILVDDQSSHLAEFIHEATLSVKSGDFNTMDIYNRAVLDTPASGSTLSNSLAWKKVTSLSDKTTKDAYILTDWSGTYSEGGDEDSCEEQSCGLGKKWNPETCKCEFQFIDGGDLGQYCISPKVWNSITKSCQCPSQACITPKVLNQTTCKCETPGGFEPVNPCNISCPNGAINVTTCKCIPWQVAN